MPEQPPPQTVDGPAAGDVVVMDVPLWANDDGARPEASGRPGPDPATPSAKSVPAPVRWNRRPALAASIVVAMVGAGLVLGRHDEPAPPSAATEARPAAVTEQPDAVRPGARAWSDLPRPTAIEPAGPVAAATEASRIEPSGIESSGIAAVEARPAEVPAGPGPDPASRLVAPPLVEVAPRSPAVPTVSSPPHSAPTAVPALAGLIPPNEAPTIDPGGARAATMAVPLPPRRPASFQKPRALTALSPGSLPPSRGPEPTDAVGPEEYAAFAARPHEPGVYRIRWGVARLRESANDESARGPSWDFPPDQ